MSENSTRAALLKAQHTQFIKNPEYQLEVVPTDEGPIVKMGGEEIPLLESAINLQIVQPGHATNNKALAKMVGQILVLWDTDNPTEDASEKLLLLPITLLGYQYKNFGPYGDKSSEKANLICYSTSDGLRPSPKVMLPVNDVCCEVTNNGYGMPWRTPVCPKAVWGQGGEKPECRAEVTLAFFDLERKIPVRLQLHGTGLGAYNKMLRAYRENRNVARFKKKSMNDYILELTVETEGTFVRPVFKITEPPAEIGDPKQWLPVCKFYMDTIFKPRALDEDKQPSAIRANDDVTLVDATTTSAGTAEQAPVSAEAAVPFEM